MYFGGEIHDLSKVLPPNCTLLAEKNHGFEDMAKINGGLIALSSDHSHFKFQFGKGMREIIQDKISNKQVVESEFFFIDDNHSDKVI